MAEVVDAAHLKCADGDVVGVQVPLPPLTLRQACCQSNGRSGTKILIGDRRYGPAVERARTG